MVKNMRTIRQHHSEDAMTHRIKKLFLTPSAFDDAAGVAVLFILLFLGLTLSGAA